MAAESRNKARNVGMDARMSTVIVRCTMTDSARTPLVFLPGMLLNGDLFAAQVAALDDLADCRVSQATFAADALVGMAQAVLDENPGPFALAGMSMGGYVAQIVAHLAPDRVSRLALLSTGHRPDRQTTREQRERLIEQARHGQFNGLSRGTFAQWVHPDRGRDQDLYQRVLTMTRASGRDVFARQQRATLERPDVGPWLRQIGCPTLVLCGRQDLITPPELSEEMAATIPGANLVLLEECGHLSPLEQPEAVTTALRDWLVA